MSDMPNDPETIKAHMLARQEAIVVCTQENTLLSQRLRQLIGPVAWLEWMQANMKDNWDDMLKNWLQKNDQGA